MNEGVRKTEFDIINITLQQHWLLETLLEGKINATCFFHRDVSTVVTFKLCCLLLGTIHL